MILAMIDRVAENHAGKIVPFIALLQANLLFFDA